MHRIPFILFFSDYWIDSGVKLCHRVSLQMQLVLRRQDLLLTAMIKLLYRNDNIRAVNLPWGSKAIYKYWLFVIAITLSICFGAIRFLSVDSNNNAKRCLSRGATVDTYVWSCVHIRQLPRATGAELAVCHEDSRSGCLCCVTTSALSYDVPGGQHDVVKYTCRIFTFILDEDVYPAAQPVCLTVGHLVARSREYIVQSLNVWCSSKTVTCVGGRCDVASSCDSVYTRGSMYITVWAPSV